MRLIICCGRFPAPSETFVTSQVQGLERRGHTVAVMAEQVDAQALARLSGGPPSGGVFALGSKGIHPLSGRLAKLELLLRSLGGVAGWCASGAHFAKFLGSGLFWRGILSAEAHRKSAWVMKPDLVHAHFGHMGLWAKAVALRHRVPLAVTFHGYDATKLPTVHGWSTYRTLLDHPAAMFIAHSPFIADRLRKGLGISPRLVPLGVDTDLFAPAPHDRAPRPGPRLAFVGRVIPQKGIRLAIETLALLRGGKESARLLATLDVVGEGPELTNAISIAQILGVRSEVHLHGPQPPEGVAAILRDSDFLLVPSVRNFEGAEEAFGLVCLEAQACGVLVVGTYCGGLPAAVAQPVGGRCVPQHSPTAMAAAVRELWSRPDLESLRHAARRRIVERHALSATIQGYEQAFQMALSCVEEAPREDCTPFWSEARSGEGEVSSTAGNGGSLPAYVLDRDVGEVRRDAFVDMKTAHLLAANWTKLRLHQFEAGVPLGPKRYQVILDLEGADPSSLPSRARSYREVLRPEGFAILGVRAGKAQAKHLQSALQSSFATVLLIDPLFQPTPRPLNSAGALADSASGDALREPPVRYLLCGRG